MEKLRITVWNEFRHEKSEERIRKVYPEGIHMQIKKVLEAAGHTVRTATLDEPEHGLTEEVLRNTDVLFWWGHMAHQEVSDEIVQRVYDRVQAGMGFVALHSAHESKIFKKLLGCTGSLNWREDDTSSRAWVVNPAHPIVQGVGPYIDLPMEEMYGEPFGIPTPDEVVFISWFKGGEVLRSGCTFQRGYGKIFYFQPGHESYPTYYNEKVQRVLQNAAEWARPVILADSPSVCHNVKALEY
jgi:trehalose utilization protein